MLIDIDHFKLYNDTYGHMEGDECLRTVAATLDSIVSRPGDLVARYGGEEFVIILPNTSEQGLKEIAEKILVNIAALNIPHSASKTSNRITVSIGGYTMVPNQGHDPDYLIAQADKSLYKAKASGRNRFILQAHLKRVPA